MEFQKKLNEIEENKTLIDSLKKALDLVSAQFDSRGIDVEIYCDKGVLIEGYETLLEQVFINLLTNARDAFEENKINDPKIKIICEFDKKGDFVASHVGMVGKDILMDLTNKLSKEK